MNRATTKTHSRRNFVALLIEAIGWPLGQSFFSPQTILPMFVARLTGSNAAVGLMNGVQSFGFLVPQLLAAKRVEQLPLVKRYVFAVSMLGERLPILVLAIATFLVRDPALLLAIFMACWAVHNLATGLCLPACLGLFAKAIEKNQRGKITGLGNGLGTLVATGGAYIARHLLGTGDGLSGYAWCFLLGSVILLLTFAPVGLVNETCSQTKPRHHSLLEYLNEVPSIVRENRPFSNYIVMQALLHFPLAGVSFLTSYTVLNLGVPEPVVALCTVLYLSSYTVGSTLWGLLGDARGYRGVFIAGSLFGVVTFLAVSALPPVSVVYAAFVASGLFSSSVWVGGNMSLEFCDASRAGTYSAVVFTCTAPSRIALPIAAGWAADSLGLAPVFVALALSCLLAFYLAVWRVSDPRTTGMPGRATAEHAPVSQG